MGGHRDEESGRRRRHHQQQHAPPVPAPPALGDYSSSHSPSHEHRRPVQRSEGMTPRSTQGRFPSVDARRDRDRDREREREPTMAPSTINLARSSTMPYRRPSDSRAYPGGADDPAAYPPTRRYSAGQGGSSSYESRRYSSRRESAPLYEDDRRPPRVASPEVLSSDESDESEEEETSEDDEEDDSEEESSQEEEEADDERSPSRRRGRHRPTRGVAPSSGGIPSPPRRYQRPESPSSDDAESSAPESPSQGASLRRRALEGTPQPRMLEAPPFRREPTATPSPRTSRSRVSSVRAESRPPVSTKRPSKRGKAAVINQEPAPIRTRNMTPSSRSSVRSSSRHRSTSVLDNLRGGPNGHRTTPEKMRSKDHGRDKAIKSVECVICMENKSQAKAPKLKCGHRMCNSCLKRSFDVSLKDPQTMPPKCCGQNIPLKNVGHLLDDAFKMKWNQKSAENKTKNKLYCPSKECNEWIKPTLIKQDGQRESARCGRCNTKVCVSCHAKWHKSPDCPRDEDTLRFLRQAKEEGWQRCYECKAVVERQQGCNHMTCRCGAQFCMVCGVPWRNCDCEWFNFEADNAGPYLAERAHSGDAYEAPPVPRLVRGATEPLPRSSARPRSRNQSRNRPETGRHRRRQGQDEDLARRLQYQMSLDGERSEEEEEYHDDDDDDDDDDDILYERSDEVGLGITSTRAGSEHFEHRRRRSSGKHTSLPPAPEPPLGRSYEKDQQEKRELRELREHREQRELREQREQTYPSSRKYETAPKYDRGGGSYVTEVHRARGSRGSKGERSRSMERRLAGRLSETRYHTPGRSEAPMGAPAHMSPQHHNMSPHMGPPPPMPPMAGPPYGQMPMPMPMAMPMSMPPPARGPMMMGAPMPPPAFRTQQYSATYAPPAPDFMAGGEKGPFGSPDMEGRRRRESETVPRSSTLAGLDGPPGGAGRVYEWRNFVDPNYDDAASVES